MSVIDGAPRLIHSADAVPMRVVRLDVIRRRLRRVQASLGALPLDTMTADGGRTVVTAVQDLQIVLDHLLEGA